VKSTDCIDISTYLIHLWPSYISWFSREWSNSWDF